METTHMQSAGDVLPANDENTDFEDVPAAPLTFEQRTIRTLIGLERRRLKMQARELDMEAERLALHSQSVRDATNVRLLLATTVKEAMPLVLPVLLASLAASQDGAPLDDDAFNAAIADIAREFPDLKETLEGRVRARREAESRASVG